MANKRTEVLTETIEKTVSFKKSERKYEIVYESLITIIIVHLQAIYGLYLCFTDAKWATVAFAYPVYVLGSLGVTAGSHRLWAHKTYKAKLPLEILLMLMNSIAAQYTAVNWVRDHRLHHKCSDTDADPHNANRGFFFSHIGWLLVRKHPDVRTKGKEIEMSDIYNNRVLMFQKKYAIPLMFIMCFGLPTFIPIYYWGESWSNAWHVSMFRYVASLHLTSLVNSAAHKWGNKPFDKNILPGENPLLSFVVLGEGFHNYHHAFPFDYRTAELGNNYLNFTTKFIDFFAAIGWAYDLKTVSPKINKERSLRTGDGTNLGFCK